MMRNNVGKYPKLEEALLFWFQIATSNNLLLNDDMIIENGKEFGKKLGVPDNFCILKAGYRNGKRDMILGW